jgi:electron transport complex protein RnfC
MIGTLFRFHGGIKPATNKDASTREPIAAVPLQPRYVVPLHQHIGGTPRPLVQPGQRVLKGERIGAADGNISAAVHAPTSGTVAAIEPMPVPHPSGLPALCVAIDSDGEERWCERERIDPDSASDEALRLYLRDAGIVGLGGAVFPSHVKLAAGAPVRTLIVNGAECEPFITCDDMLMRERAREIVLGAAIMRRMLGAERVLIGVEDNKPQALAAMRAAVPADVEVVAVPTLYPAGGEKQLVRVLTGVEMPAGRRPTEFGIQCFNVGTACRLYRAVAHGEPLISRVVTVAGNVERPRNYEVPIGTPIEALAALAGPLPDTDRYVMGGPMMGFTLPSTAAPVIKATNCIIAASPRLFPPPPPEMPCIRCGSCARVCPAELQPFELYWFARARNFGKAQEYALFDCIECGCCAYVCPSHIPLVDYYRYAKAEVRSRERDKAAADTARSRFEFRNERIEREKREKAEKLAAKTAAARQEAEKKAAAAAPKPAATPEEEEAARKKALIAAAAERAKRQKDAVQPKNTQALTPEQQAEIAEIEQRRAKIRAMAKTPEGTSE